MKRLFLYNWQVRDEWFEIFRGVPQEELVKMRVGGMGSILKTLFHIVDVEYAWIMDIKGKEFEYLGFEAYPTLDAVIKLSNDHHGEVADFVDHWTSDQEAIEVTDPGNGETFTRGEVIRHIIAHEIHHAGQLYIWAREIGANVPSANLIRRGLG